MSGNERYVQRIVRFGENCWRIQHDKDTSWSEVKLALLLNEEFSQQSSVVEEWQMERERMRKMSFARKKKFVSAYCSFEFTVNMCENSKYCVLCRMRKNFSKHGKNGEISMKCLSTQENGKKNGQNGQNGQKNGESDGNRNKLVFTRQQLIEYARTQLYYYKTIEEDCLRAFCWSMYVTKQVD